MNFSKVAGLNQLNRKIAPIKSTTPACLFFFPFYSCFTSSLQFSSEAMKYMKLFFSSLDPTIQCSLFYEENIPLWSQQISFLNDYETTRQARMLQAPITGRKISAKLTNRCRGESSILLGMFQAKENWISSARFRSNH